MTGGHRLEGSLYPPTPVNRASRQPRGCCWIVLQCVRVLDALASPSPMILLPVSGKELQRHGESGDGVTSVYLPVLLLGLWQL